MKREFIVTIATIDGKSVTQVIHFDPTDMYDAALASVIRSMGRQLTGERL